MNWPGRSSADTVQRYFPVAKGSPTSEFTAIADQHSVLELRPPSYCAALERQMCDHIEAVARAIKVQSSGSGL
jgi:hypothetical protein